MREQVGPLTLKPEHSLISGYFNLDNGGGKLLGIYAENNAAIVPIVEQWIAPLKDLGVTTVSMRPSGSTDHESFDQAGIFPDSSSFRTRATMKLEAFTPIRMFTNGFLRVPQFELVHNA
jgi:hypothetical protein